MEYKTRHLIALQEIPHGRRLVAIGERFKAVDIDANFYLTRNMAAEVPYVPETETITQPPTAPDAPPAPRRGRPTNAARAAAAAAAAAADKPGDDE